MAPELHFRRSKGDMFRSLRRLSAPSELSVFVAFLFLGWLTARFPIWAYPGLGMAASEQPVSCPVAEEGPFNMTAHQAKLVAQIRANAPLHLVDTCVEMVLGNKWFLNKAPFHRPFSQGYQDWVMYHSFFSRMEYREGFYVDVGASDPINGSNTYFFDACLGWQGLCVEPNPIYVEGFKALRTCTHVKNCIGPEETDLHFPAEKGSMTEGGQGLTVRCRPLQNILAEHGVGMTHKGQRRIDFASLDTEGSEQPSLRCFPFDLFDIPLLVVETGHQKEHSIDSMMARAGYWMSPQLILQWKRGWAEQPPSLGYHFDNLFVRWRQPSWILGQNASTDTSIAEGKEGKDPLEVPPLVLGPDFLPGGALEGESFVAPCSGKEPSDCPQHVPAVEDQLEYNDGAFVSGECKPYAGIKHRLSIPVSE